MRPKNTKYKYHHGPSFPSRAHSQGEGRVNIKKRSLVLRPTLAEPKPCLTYTSATIRTVKGYAHPVNVLTPSAQSAYINGKNVRLGAQNHNTGTGIQSGNIVPGRVVTKALVQRVSLPHTSATGLGHQPSVGALARREVRVMGSICLSGHTPPPITPTGVTKAKGGNIREGMTAICRPTPKDSSQLSTKLNFGLYGLKTLENGIITDKQIESIVKAIKKKLKKQGQF